jgi:hypothetical protein
LPVEFFERRPPPHVKINQEIWTVGIQAPLSASFLGNKSPTLRAAKGHGEKMALELLFSRYGN